MLVSFALIGTSSKRPVLKGIRVAAGRLLSTIARTRSSRSSSLPAIAVAAPLLTRCTRSEKKYKRRTITVRPQAQHEALQAARRRPQTRAFTKQYALREGIEDTISQGVRAFGMRRSRYLGLAKTHLQHLGIAAGINVVRAVAWLDGNELAPTRLSAFQRLYLAA
jgi:hypothetical protein